jgi:hypothetical protein
MSCPFRIITILSAPFELFGRNFDSWDKSADMLLAGRVYTVQ